MNNFIDWIWNERNFEYLIARSIEAIIVIIIIFNANVRENVWYLNACFIKNNSKKHHFRLGSVAISKIAVSMKSENDSTKYEMIWGTHNFYTSLFHLTDVNRRESCDFIFVKRFEDGIEFAI